MPQSYESIYLLANDTYDDYKGVLKAIDEARSTSCFLLREIIMDEQPGHFRGAVQRELCVAHPECSVRFMMDDLSLSPALNRITSMQRLVVESCVQGYSLTVIQFGVPDVLGLSILATMASAGARIMEWPPYRKGSRFNDVYSIRVE